MKKIMTVLGAILLSSTLAWAGNPPERDPADQMEGFDFGSCDNRFDPFLIVGYASGRIEVLFMDETLFVLVIEPKKWVRQLDGSYTEYTAEEFKAAFPQGACDLYEKIIANRLAV